MIRQSPEVIYDLSTADGASELEDRVQCRLGGQLREFRLVVFERGVILR